MFADNYQGKALALSVCVLRGELWLREEEDLVSVKVSLGVNLKR